MTNMGVLVFLAGVMVALFGGGSLGAWGERRHACANYGRLLHVETQYRDGDCQLRNGDGWVWLEDRLEGEK